MDYVLQAALNGVDRLYFHQGTISNCVRMIFIINIYVLNWRDRHTASGEMTRFLLLTLEPHLFRIS